MWTNHFNILKAATFGLAAFFVLGCTDIASEEKVVPIKEEVKSKGVVYQPSELATTMRLMYENLKKVGKHLENGEDIPNELLEGYESIRTDEPTNPEEIGPKFQGFAEIWLTSFEAFKNEPTQSNYNTVMNSCVSCHQSYCPGPIKKIKRLKLVGSLEE